MASTVSNGNDRSEKWQRPFTKGKFATAIAFRSAALLNIYATKTGSEFVSSLDLKI